MPSKQFYGCFLGTDQHDELIGASKMLVPCQFTSLAHGMPWKRYRGNALWWWKGINMLRGATGLKTVV